LAVSQRLYRRPLARPPLRRAPRRGA